MLRVLCLLTALLIGVAAAAEEFEPEIIDMSPQDGPVGWGMRNVFAPLTSVFYGGPSYWYQPREVLINTTPHGGVVDLFYVRNGFQKRFEQAETPVTVILPPRIKAGNRDVLNIRAFRSGYRQSRASVGVNSRETEVVIDLEPLPNLLSAFSSRYFAGRASLTFLTKEALTHRVQAADNGFAVILVETAVDEGIEGALEGVASPLVASAFGQQLGEDLMVSVELSELARSDAVEPRTRERYDAARDLHIFIIDLIPTDGGAEAVARAQAALPELSTAEVSGCALEFDAALRAKLDGGALNRALSPHASFAGPYLRAAMRRLGELTPDGRVEFGDGTMLRPAVPIELEMAMIEAGSAKGYLALLRSFVSLVEGEAHLRETLRSLIAPEIDAANFASLMDAAEERERSCRAAS